MNVIIYQSPVSKINLNDVFIICSQPGEYETYS